jgi:hypothetical protein
MAGRDNLEMAKVDAVCDVITELYNDYYVIILPEIFNPTENRVRIKKVLTIC